MPKKVPFRVVSCTGWEDAFPPKDLEVHSPFSKGWRSPRYCLYPQEVVISINPPARIRKLQLLSHQYMIASKIELYVGSLPATGTHVSTEHAQFTRLGYISLSDNEHTGFRSRELKSVNLDVHGQLIKLVLHQNHINRLNLFNQVALVALNVISDSLSEQEVGGIPSHMTTFVARKPQESLSEVVHSYLPSYRHSQDADPILLGAINKSSLICPMDDLAFAIAQDPETANLIRRLELKKQTAVKVWEGGSLIPRLREGAKTCFAPSRSLGMRLGRRKPANEKFDFAKQLKQIIAELQKIGEVLCRYEVEKKLAIEREDYDTAKERKLQADKLRQEIYNHLGIHGLFNGSVQPSPRQQLSDRSHPRVRNPPFASDGENLLAPSLSSHYTKVSPKHSPLLPPIQPYPSGHSHQHSVATYDINDERPLPALVNKPAQHQSVEAETTLETSPPHAPERSDSPVHFERPEPLSGKQQNEVPNAIEIFGMKTVEYVYAKQYSLRERGLQMVQEALYREVHSRRGLTNHVKATCQVLRKALRDKVLSSYTIALDLLKYLLGPYCQQHKLGKQDLSFIIEKILPVLLERGGDMAPRIRSAAMDIVLELAQQQQIKNLTLIGPQLVQQFKQQNAPWRLVKSRIGLLDRFIHDVGMQTGGITLRGVMDFINPCLEHTSGEVRDAAVNLTLALYKVHGQGVRSLLIVSDDPTVPRKIFWKTLFDGFDKIDGVPTLQETEAMERSVEETKKEEIKKLQAQVNTLRNLAAQGQTLTEGELSTALQPPGGGAGASKPPQRGGQQEAGPSQQLTEGELSTALQPPGGGAGASKPPQRGGQQEAGPSQQLTEGELSTALQPPGGGAGSRKPPQREGQQEAGPSQQNPAELDKTCVFCGERREDFTDTKLEAHYLNECPMLQQCKFCSQVVEIADLTKHWLVECESKGEFQECPRCKEAIQVAQFDNHVKTDSCPVAPGDGNSNRCPLCHSDIPMGDEGWKSHLMSSVVGCSKNPRRKKKTRGRGTLIPRAAPPPKKPINRNPQRRNK